MSLPVPAQDPSTNTAIAPIPVFFRLVNGSITGGAPLYDVTTINPSGLYYAARAYDNFGNLVFFGNFIVQGTTFNLGTAIPTSITTSNISYANVAFLALKNIFTGNNTHSGSETFNGPVTFSSLFADDSERCQLSGVAFNKYRSGGDLGEHGYL